jgi:hypothetical protein
MNCLTFRRQLMVDPQHWDDALKTHAEQCAACGRARERALAFEASLFAALLLDHDGAAADIPERDGGDADDAPPPSAARPRKG